MKPQTQEFPMHEPQNGVIGDCFRAALASLLGLGIRQVPHLAKEYFGDEQGYDQALNQFLGKRGLMLLLFPYGQLSKLLQEQAQSTGADCYHLIFGIDHDGDGHACVGLNGLMIHDPHPLQRGFANPPSEWQIGLMVNRLSDAPMDDGHQSIDALLHGADPWDCS